MRLLNPRVLSDKPPRVTERPLFFNTLTISRFMRVSYGSGAPEEAKRHISTYLRAGRHELVEIWKRVLAHLCGVEIKEDARRILRRAKSLAARNR